MNNRHRVLIYQQGHIGDTIVSIPSLRSIRRHFKRPHEIWLLHKGDPRIPTNPSDILVQGQEIDTFISYPGTGGLQRWIIRLALWWRLRRIGFDCVVYTGNRITYSRRKWSYKIFFWMCGIRQQIGFSAVSRQDCNPTDANGRPLKTKHESLFRLERLERDGINISAEAAVKMPLIGFSESELAATHRWLTLNRKYPRHGLIAICPGTKQPANSWPIERFIEIGRRISKLNCYEIIICGGEAERSIGEQLIRSWGDGLNAAGAFSVKDSAALLSQCQFVIGLDTGTTHLAAAAGSKCITIQGGRNNPGLWDPLGEGHVIVRHPVPCTGCWLFECNQAGHPCMRDISVDDVWDAVLKVSQSNRI